MQQFLPTPVPRFHLHLWEDACLIPDEMGTELSDRDAAILMARRSLGEMLCEDIRADLPISGRCIVIADDRGTTLAEICADQILSSGRPERSTSFPLPEPQVA